MAAASSAKKVKSSDGGGGSANVKAIEAQYSKAEKGKIILANAMNKIAGNLVILYNQKAHIEVAKLNIFKDFEDFKNRIDQIVKTNLMRDSIVFFQFSYLKQGSDEIKILCQKMNVTEEDFQKLKLRHPKAQHLINICVI